MPKSNKIAKLRKDNYYKLAKEAGYRSRAAFKLIQLNRKFGFLNNCQVVVDLCAAPGGWLQVASQVLPISSIIVGVDLFPIKSIENTSSIVGDITTFECFQNIKNIIGNHQVDCVLHDGAPNLGTSWEIDAFGQNQLTLHALKLAVKLLKDNGTFVTKVFRSKDYPSLISTLKKIFKHVHATKPLASRKESAEIFVVCQNFIGSKNIDKEILNFAKVFKDINESDQKLTLKSYFKQIKKNKSHREGYDTDTGLLYSKLNASDFINTEENPVELLAKANEIVFDDKKLEETLPGTLAEYCKDLKLLGYNEFKQLLDWRRKIAIDLKKASKERPVKEIVYKTDEEILQNEIDETINQSQHSKKVLNKKILQSERQQRLRMKNLAKFQKETNVDDIEFTALKNLVLGDQDHFCDVEDHNTVQNNDIDFSSDLEEVSFQEYSDDNSYLAELDEQLDNQRELLTSFKAKRKRKLDFIDEKLEKSKDFKSNTDLEIFTDESGDSDKDMDMEFLLKSKKTEKKTIEKKETEKTLPLEPVAEIETSIETSIELTPQMKALALKMKQSKKKQQEIIDELCSKNVRPPQDDLPSWFVDDEKKATRINLPITKEEVNYFKMLEKQSDLMPSKKHLEAKHRKKMKIQKLLKQAKSKTDKLLTDNLEEEEVYNDKEKISSIKKIYKNVGKQLKKKEKKYVIGKASSSEGKKTRFKAKNVKGPYKVVDARMKKDKRADTRKVGKTKGSKKHRKRR